MPRPADSAGGPPDLPPALPPAVWDPIVRVTHWGIVLAVLSNWTLTAESDTAHVWIGYLAAALLALRLVWGLVGPAEARFSAFPPSPRAALAHLADLAAGRPKPAPSHNPAGALMVYAFWATLAVLVATGLTLADGGPLAVSDRETVLMTGDWSQLALDEDDDGEAGEMVEELHEGAATLILILAVLHVAGIALESRMMRMDLLRPMLFGRRPRRGR